MLGTLPSRRRPGDNNHNQCFCDKRCRYSTVTRSWLGVIFQFFDKIKSLTRREKMPQVSRPLLGSTHLPIHWSRGANEAVHLPPSNVEVKNMNIFTSNPPYVFIEENLIKQAIYRKRTFEAYVSLFEPALSIQSFSEWGPWVSLQDVRNTVSRTAVGRTVNQSLRCRQRIQFSVTALREDVVSAFAPLWYHWQYASLLQNIFPWSEGTDSVHEWKKWGGFNPLDRIVRGTGYWGHRPEITESCTQPTGLQVNLINEQAQSARLSPIHTLSDIHDSNTKIVERRLNVLRT
jgi:hypothetical protein